MTGESLKSFITALDVSQAEVARKLGMSPQALDSMLKTKDVKTGLVEQLSRVYKKPISFFFDENETAPVNVEAVDHSIAAVDSNITIGDFKELKSKVKYLEDLLSEKDKRIELQEKLITRLETN